jgi:hypothetical protein
MLSHLGGELEESVLMDRDTYSKRHQWGHNVTQTLWVIIMIMAKEGEGRGLILSGEQRFSESELLTSIIADGSQVLEASFERFTSRVNDWLFVVKRGSSIARRQSRKQVMLAQLMLNPKHQLLYVPLVPLALACMTAATILINHFVATVAICCAYS